MYRNSMAIAIDLYLKLDAVASLPVLVAVKGLVVVARAICKNPEAGGKPAAASAAKMIGISFESEEGTAVVVGVIDKSSETGMRSAVAVVNAVVDWQPGLDIEKVGEFEEQHAAAVKWVIDKSPEVVDR